jgi:hypothetical protein
MMALSVDRTHYDRRAPARIGFRDAYVDSWRLTVLGAVATEAGSGLR